MPAQHRGQTRAPMPGPTLDPTVLNQNTYQIKYNPTAQAQMQIDPSRFQLPQPGLSARDRYSSNAQNAASWSSRMSAIAASNAQRAANLKAAQQQEAATKAAQQQVGFGQNTQQTNKQTQNQLGIEQGTSGRGNYGTTDFRTQIIDRAKSYLGVPYQLGGGHAPKAVTPTKGFNGKVGLDCSGLTGIVFRQMGINLPAVANQQTQYGKRTAIANARPGDLVGWNKGGHVAIYLGNGYIIHAPRPGMSVTIRKLFNGEKVYAVALTLPGD